MTRLQIAHCLLLAAASSTAFAQYQNAVDPTKPAENPKERLRELLNKKVGQTYWYTPAQRTEPLRFYNSASDFSQENYKESFLITGPISLTFLPVDYGDSPYERPSYKVQFPDGRVGYVKTGVSMGRCFPDLPIQCFSDKSPADNASEQARQAAAQKKAQAVAASKPKKEGVAIGMTKEQVLSSNWGRPQSVNKTITANGTREQWVYNGGYLYFDNGVLTTIQN